jgi:hypothetical protein
VTTESGKAFFIETVDINKYLYALQDYLNISSTIGYELCLKNLKPTQLKYTMMKDTGMRAGTRWQ